MFKLTLSDLFEYLCYRSKTTMRILILPVRDRLYTSESEVYRRQILTYKDGPRAERVKIHSNESKMLRNFLFYRNKDMLL